MTDLTDLDACAQADLVRAGQTSPLELVDAAIDRIEQLNPAINAVIHTDYERARATAQSPDLPNGPFRGVPFLLKDIGATQEGLPYWMGNLALKEMDHQSKGDTELGARFRRAGLITVGKTNLPELGSSPTSQPLSCGATNNPWDLERSPAGSSGGSAAAVASGMVPIAHANDGGGSTRLPAAWCGLVGLKTTRGRVPNPGNVSRLTSELVVSRSVRDTATLLDAVEGALTTDLFQLPRPVRPYVDELTADPGRLRIGVLTDGGNRVIDPDCVSGVDATAHLLEGMGHEIVPMGGDVLFGGDATVNGQLWMGGIARRVAMLGELAGRPLTADEVEPYNWTAAQRGASLTAAEWSAASERQQAWAAEVITWMTDVDILLTPTAGCPPMKTEDLWPPLDKPWKVASTYALIGLFTLPFNVTGQPAISLPLHETEDGLPVGIQLVAGMGREDLLIQLSTHLESALPWAHRCPCL
ncbi:MAG: amidase [Actinomycetia bacterium]|nr:amidase [Actinomycetes bacterium]